MTIKAKRVTLFFLALSILAVQGFSAETDIVYFKPGRDVGGSDTVPPRDSETKIRVVKETWKDVVVEYANKSTIVFPREYIESIEYFDTPMEYTLALSAIRDGKLDTAFKHLKRIKTDGKRRWLAVHKLFYTAKAHLLAGETDKKTNKKALRLYEEFHAKYPDTRFTWDVLIGRAAALFQSDDHAGALKKLQEMKASVPPGSRGEHLAELWRGKVYEFGTKEYEKARKSYLMLASSAGREYPALSSKARVGELRCLALGNRHQEALRKARKLTEKGGSKDPIILANAWSVIGDCLIATGNGPEKSNDALMAYLRVVVVYNRDAGLAARAAFKAAECFETTNSTDRAADLYRKASGIHGGGEWSQKAATRLK